MTVIEPANLSTASTPNCPPWCVEHYQGEGGTWNHSSYPEVVIGANVWTGAPMELGYWVERRDDPDVQETVVVLEVSKLAEDIELTPDALAVFATRLIGLASRAKAISRTRMPRRP
jgi:hypothetical protein